MVAAVFVPVHWLLHHEARAAAPLRQCQGRLRTARNAVIATSSRSYVLNWKRDGRHVHARRRLAALAEEGRLAIYALVMLLYCASQTEAPQRGAVGQGSVGCVADEDGFKTVDIYKSVTRLTNQYSTQDRTHAKQTTKRTQTQTRKHTRRHTPAQDNQPTQPASHTSTTPPHSLTRSTPELVGRQDPRLRETDSGPTTLTRSHGGCA